MLYRHVFFILFICFVGILNIYAQPVEIIKTEGYRDLITWRHIGPFRGGRSCAVTGVVGKNNLFYFGSTGGGVWKSDDAGIHWDNISDGYFGGSIGAIAVAESDPNVIYVGGGEKTVRGNVSSGYGLWKSVDAGATWKHVGLSNSKHITRIRIHPKNADIAYIAVLGNIYKKSKDRGVYKTIDGGKTWKLILFSSEDAGAVDLVLDPNNARHLYASTWNVRRTPHSLSSGGEGSALWKSTDSGNSWENISENEGLPDGDWGISGIAVSPANSNRVWAIIENKNGGVYRSDDRGQSWIKLNNTRALRQRAWYYTRIYADTQDPEIVYVMNVDYHKSTDGGKTFTSHRAPHGDHHDLWIDPADPSRLIIGDDGGAQISVNGGNSWSSYENQPTAQFYRVTTDNAFPYRIYVAQQDNSALRIKHRTEGKAITATDWESTAGGESAHITIHPDNNDLVVGGSYGGYLVLQDHDEEYVRAINVYPDNPMGHGAEGFKYRFQWNFPVLYSKKEGFPLLAASNHMHMSLDNGQSWDVISPDLTRNDTTKLGPSGGPITKDNTGVEYYCTIFSVKESPLKPGMLWIGTDDGKVHFTDDFMTGEWHDVTPKDSPKWLMINSIEPDPFDKASCYIAGTLYKTGDFNPYLYKTEDYGKTWKKIVSGIPSNHFTRVLRADPLRRGMLYVGTETGVYISYNDGKTWETLQYNLPIVPITDLAIKNDNLIAATQGRSIWLLDDLTLLQQAKQIQSNEVYFFKPIDSYRFGQGQEKEGISVGLNHHSGVEFNFILPSYSENDSVQLILFDPQLNLVRSFSNHAEEKDEKLKLKEGVNKFVWNMRYPSAKKFEGMVLWAGSLQGAKAIPDNAYLANLIVNGVKYTQSFNILKAQNGIYSIEDYRKQFHFLQSINNKLSEAHQTIIDIRKLKPQIESYKKQVKQDSALCKHITKLENCLINVEEALYQTKNQSRQDPLNFPIRLTNKLAYLNTLTSIGEFGPTQQVKEVKDALIVLIDEQLDKYKSIIKNDVPKLNHAIKNANIDAIQLPD